MENAWKHAQTVKMHIIGLHALIISTAGMHDLVGYWLIYKTANALPNSGSGLGDLLGDFVRLSSFFFASSATADASLVAWGVASSSPASFSCRASAEGVVVSLEVSSTVGSVLLSPEVAILQLLHGSVQGLPTNKRANIKSRYTTTVLKQVMRGHACALFCKQQRLDNVVW